jgi:predicted transcriptional regulator
MAKLGNKKRHEVPRLPQLDYAKMAAQVRGARAVLNWSQTELGARAGLTQRSIHRLEQGASDIRRSTVLAIEHVFSEAGVQFESLPDSGFKIVISGRTLKKVSLAGRK